MELLPLVKDMTDVEILLYKNKTSHENYLRYSKEERKAWWATVSDLEKFVRKENKIRNRCIMNRQNYLKKNLLI